MDHQSRRYSGTEAPIKGEFDMKVKVVFVNGDIGSNVSLQVEAKNGVENNLDQIFDGSA